MKIVASEVMMNSGHELVQENQLNEQMNLWANSPESNTIQDTSPGNLLNNKDSVTISPEARQAKTASTSSDQDDDILSSKDEAKIKMIKILLEALTGKKFNISVLRLNKYDDQQVIDLRRMQQNSGQGRSNWGLTYDRVETYHEMEQSSFSAQAVIKTADGREINTSQQLNMTREFMSRNEVHIRAGSAPKDPLVINFDRPAASLGQRNFRFDLDADGTEEQISMLAPGSGFLALDLNGDGKINDGRELFGPQSGNGFEELARYDQDNNGWIDENDEIFSRLRIWSVDEAGNQQLVALGQKGVGAIYLGHVTSPFSIKDGENESLGEVRSSGFFLRENGLMGTMQQVDLVV